MNLSQDAEEVATFYGRMLDHDYTTMEAFNKNFMKDWRKVGNSRIQLAYKPQQFKKDEGSELESWFQSWPPPTSAWTSNEKMYWFVMLASRGSKEAVVYREQ